MAQDSQLAAIIRQLQTRLAALEGGQRGGGGYIDSFAGPRSVYTLVGSQTFTTAQAGTRGAAINLPVSADGPFVATHYPMIMWRPSSPANATNYGKWSPVYHSPLPAQELANLDLISVSYEMYDSGGQLNWQPAAGPPLISLPGSPIALPAETMIAQTSILSITPTYEAISFHASAATPTTGGTLVVAVPGYRIRKA